MLNSPKVLTSFQSLEMLCQEVTYKTKLFTYGTTIPLTENLIKTPKFALLVTKRNVETVLKHLKQKSLVIQTVRPIIGLWRHVGEERQECK